MSNIKIKEVATQEQLADELNEKMCVIKLWSESCGPCKVYNPKFEDMATKYKNINFLACKTSTKLFPPMAVPTTLVVMDGVITDKIVGGNVPKVMEAIDKCLSN